jgi:peptide/nickel transport system substrate-binding protein
VHQCRRSSAGGSPALVRLPVIVLALAFASLATACDSARRGDGGRATSTSSSARAVTNGPARGGRVVYGLEADTPGGFCLPEDDLGAAGVQVARAIYDTLTAPDEKGEYRPYLARSVTPNATFTRWTIGLRPGVTFHDGSILDAVVVKNNLDAYRGRYPGRAAAPSASAYADIADVAVVDATTVTVTMTSPWVSFPAYLFGDGRRGIMAQAQLDDPATCDRKLIGTGPFMVKGGTVADTRDIVAVRNPSYWQKDVDGGPLPYLDELEYRALPDNDARLAALVNGQISVLQTDVPDVIARLRSLKDQGAVALTESTASAEVGSVVFNTSRAPFDNADARAAVALAFDAEAYAEIEDGGLYERATGPFPKGTPGYLADTGYPTFDLGKAREKMAAYVLATGKSLRFSLIVPNDPLRLRGAELFRQMMKDAGIAVDVVASDGAQLAQSAGSGEFQAMDWRSRSSADPDAQYPSWHSGSPLNFGRIVDPDIERLLDDGRSNPDAAARTRDYEALNKVFAQRLYTLWTFVVDRAVATAPGVRGLVGPALPDGDAQPSPALTTGHSVAGLYLSP